jgi:hypothetical protein
MKKYCGNCGADLITDAKFCGNCGTVLEQKPKAQSQESAGTGQSSSPPDQPQVYIRQPPKKPNAKILAGVAIIAVAVVLVVVFLIFFTGGNGGGGFSNQFVGAWNLVSGGSSETSIYTTYVFEANGDFKVGSAGTYVRVGTWRTESGILYLESIQGTTSPSGTTGVAGRYIFSDDGRTLTIYPINGGSTAVFTKQ